MLYASDCRAVARKIEKSNTLSVVEMRILRSMLKLAKADRMRNDHVRGNLNVASKWIIWKRIY